MIIDPTSAVPDPHDPGPVPGEQLDEADELDITLPPPAAQKDPHGRPPGHICQDDPSWPGGDE